MTAPDAVKSYSSLGVELSRKGSRDWSGDCPFCGKSGHFFVNPENGLFDCKRCSESGNFTTFMGRYCEAVCRDTPPSQFAKLAEERGIPAEVLKSCGLGFTGDQWLIPFRSDRGTVRDVQRYDGRRLMSTSGCKLQLWNLDRLASSPPGCNVYHCEGPWDGIAMQWMLKEAGRPGVVVAVPGAGTFKDDWIPFYRGRNVLTLYDNDEPGDRGQLKAEVRLRDVAASLKHAWWPEDALPEGWDVRDHAKSRVPEKGAEAALDEILALAHDRTRRRAAADGSTGAPVQKPRWTDDELPDVDFAGVVAEFSKLLEMNDDAVTALRLMLAVCLSNDVRDDPIWLYVIGAPSAGKTELLSQFQESARCLFVSSVTPHGLVSGWRGEGEKDPSLIPRLGGKTLVVKDFTEILSMPEVAQGELYSILRGAYDGYVDKVYGNGVVRKYRDCNFSVLAGSTQAIRRRRSTELGERFLQFAMQPPTPDELRRRSRKRRAALGQKKDASDDIKKAVAGYLKRKVDPKRLPGDDAASDQIEALSELVAVLRAEVPRDRFSGEITHRSDPEAWTRISLQLSQLAKILAWMEGRDQVGPEDMKVVARVAFDSASGLGTDVVAALMAVGGRGTKRDAGEATKLPAVTLGRRVDDLVYSGILEVEGDKVTSGAGGKPASVYRVSKKVAELWKLGIGDEPWIDASSKSSTFRPSSGAPSPGESARKRRRIVIVKRSTAST